MKNFKIELRWAILLSLVLMLEMLIEKVLGWHEVNNIGNQFGDHYLILILIFAGMTYLGMREKRKNYYDGDITWKRAFASGAMISVIVAILSPLVQFFNYHYISPEYFQNMIDYQVETKAMSLKGAKELYDMSFFIIQGIFNSLSLGVGLSALMALFARNKR